MSWNLCENDMHIFWEPVLGDRRDWSSSHSNRIQSNDHEKLVLGAVPHKNVCRVGEKGGRDLASHFSYKFNERLLFSKVLVFTARTIFQGKRCFCKPWVPYIYWQVYCNMFSHGLWYFFHTTRTWLPVIPKAYDVPPPIQWPWSPSRWMKLRWVGVQHRNALVGGDLFDRYCMLSSWCINLFDLKKLAFRIEYPCFWPYFAYTKSRWLLHSVDE